MKTTLKLTAVLLGVVVMVSATMTHAQLPPGPHFTFTVPLVLNNLPTEIREYIVSCSVGTAGDLTMASGSTYATISGGRVDTSVVVNVTLTARGGLAHPADATNYACDLTLSNGSNSVPGDGGVPRQLYLSSGSTARFTLASGATYRPWARGTIPR